MPNSDQNTPETDYQERFYKELMAIREHMDKVVSDMIPATQRMDENIAKLVAEGTAYSGAGASTAKGTTAAEGGGASVASKAPLTPAQRDLENASTGGGGWIGRAGNNEGFRLPQIGQLTVQDTLDYISSMAAGQARKAQNKNIQYQTDVQDLNNMKKDLGDNIFTDASKTQLIPEAQDILDRINNSNQGGGRWASVSNTVHGLASGYATGKVISDLAKQAANPFINARNLAYLTGYTGSANQGPLGLFSPFGGAAAYGLGQEASQIGFAFNNNLSPGQAHAIYSNLFGLGWYGGSSTNAMRQGLANLTQANPLLGTDPQVAQMMDQATRMGQTSINTFIDTMKQIPQAADAAHVSLQQMISDSQALGNWAIQNGGNFINGAQSANAWTSVTGTPASVLNTLMGNPMVQGQMFMQSGLLPWEQGLAPFGTQMGGILSSLNLFKNAVHLPGITQHDSIGLTNTISSNDRVAALISHYFGISSAAAKNLLGHQRGVIAGTQAWQNATDYQNRIMGAIRDNHWTGASGAASQLNGSSWNALEHQLAGAYNWNGHKMFSHKELFNIQHAGDQDVVKAYEKWYKNTYPSGGPSQGVKGGAGATYGGMKHLTAQDILSNPGAISHLPKSIVATIAKDRTAAIKRIVGQNTQTQNQGPRITVALTPQAAKALKLQGPTGLGKQQANAGGSSVNIPYGQGPTDLPSANLDTAGSAYGSSGSVNSDF